MRNEDTIEIRGVTVIRETDVALLCRMGNQNRWFAPAELLSGSNVGSVGDVGTIVLERRFAVDQGLVPFQGPHDPRCSAGRGHWPVVPGESAGGPACAGGAPAHDPRARIDGAELKATPPRKGPGDVQ